MMRIFRAFIALIFAATLVIYLRDWYKYEIRADKTVPVITIDSPLLEVDADATDEDLLAGVTAYDKKDGDLTDHIIIEGISKFVDPGVCKVYYAVSDSDDHVASTYRRIKYRDYTPPRFTMNRALCFSLLENVNISNVMGATDMLDGDITSGIIITSSDYEYGKAGTYTVSAEVSNSKGDEISITVPLLVEDRSLNAPVITLSDYLIYVEKGTQIRPYSYFESAVDSFENSVSDSLHMENNYNSEEKGVYSFHYYATDELGRTGHTILTVVVE